MTLKAKDILNAVKSAACTDPIDFTTKGVKINHDGCPSGEDTKKRLELKYLPSKGIMLAFCHHCQQGGAARCNDDLYTHYTYDSFPSWVRPDFSWLHRMFKGDCVKSVWGFQSFPDTLDVNNLHYFVSFRFVDKEAIEILEEVRDSIGVISSYITSTGEVAEAIVVGPITSIRLYDASGSKNKTFTTTITTKVFLKETGLDLEPRYSKYLEELSNISVEGERGISITTGMSYLTPSLTHEKIVVEDMVSMLVVYSARRKEGKCATVLALNGLGCSPETMKFLTEDERGYIIPEYSEPQIFLMLDGDIAGRSTSYELRDEMLPLLGDRKILHIVELPFGRKGNNSPKDFTIEEINNFIEEATRGE